MTPEQADYARRVSLESEWWTVTYTSTINHTTRQTHRHFKTALKFFHASGTIVKTHCIARNGVIMVQRKDNLSPR